MVKKVDPPYKMLIKPLNVKFYVPTFTQTLRKKKFLRLYCKSKQAKSLSSMSLHDKLIHISD